MPSWDREAYGIVDLEALVSGLGVVAPNDEARQEIIADAGILVDANNVEAYANVLKKALNTDWKDKAREQAEKFSWDKITEQYEEVLKDLQKDD